MNEPETNAPIVGRAEETAVITAALGRAQSGRGQMLFISGEPGIGKSTLARAAADLAAETTLPVFWGFAWETGGAPAYWPWTQLLRKLTEHFALAESEVNQLSKIIPTATGSQDVSLQPEQARFLLLEGVRSLLMSSGAKSPFVLVLEDLHAADNDSLQLLHYVARHIREMPVLLIGTYREADARASDATEPLWQSVRDATVLKLRRFDRDEVRQLATVHEPDVSAEFVDVLFGTSGGNPLFVGELAGVLGRASPFDIQSVALPVTIQQVIARHLAQLPESARADLEKVSVLGRRFSNEALYSMLGTDKLANQQALKLALDADVLRPATDSDWEFSHVLYRDVIYHSLDGTRRETLHQSRAELLKERIDEGDFARWGELAMHLCASGPDYRNEGIEAWREAGRFASSRLAFDEAVRSYERALEAFGEGPRFSPEKRCALLLDLAAAMLTNGETNAGQAKCLEAYEMAHTLADPELMATAALTYGRVIVVAKVDTELVDMLRSTYAALPADNPANGARVAARLASAMQPSVNPAEPMQMARDAIALARTTDDRQVIFDVLKFAVPALLDFAPVDERIALNREVEALALEFDDIPSQFRSNLRMINDAAELGDRKIMNELIDKCGRIAKRIRLPHCEWRVLSARAMRSTIEGQFEQASALIDQAQTLAEQAGDVDAYITLPVQRFAILYDWDSSQAASFEVVERSLAAAFEILPAAADYARPMFASFAYRSGMTSSGESITDQALIDRLFAGGDRFCISRVGEIAAIAGDAKLAKKAYAALLPSEECCATMGLMGMHWSGPVSYSLGLLAAMLGNLDDAKRHLELALKIAIKMHAGPVKARILESLAEISERSGSLEQSREYSRIAQELVRRMELRASRVAPDGGNDAVGIAVDKNGLTMRRDGDVWKLAYAGQTASVRDSKGMHMLSKLVDNPNREVHVLDLSGTVAATVQGGVATAGLDDKARRAYRKQIQDLNEELAEAIELADEGHADVLREEIDFISRELSRAYGIGGQDRKTGSAAERARVNVRRRIKDAIERIARQLPAAGRYLENSIKTGSYCRYRPL